jgi:hypothetical protein
LFCFDGTGFEFRAFMWYHMKSCHQPSSPLSYWINHHCLVVGNVQG